jgi:hypothetical protein
MSRVLIVVVLVGGCGGTTTGGDAGSTPGDGHPTSFLSISPGTADFGMVAVGATGSAMEFTISAGTKEQTSLALSVTGPFVLGSMTCGTSLAAGATCTAEVSAAPTAVNDLHGTLQASAALELTDAVLSVTPTTVDNLITVAPTMKAFGDVAVGSSAAQTFTVTNTGAQTQGPLQITFSGSTEFNAASNNHCEDLSLGGGTTCMFDITFAPTAAGSAVGEIDVAGLNTVAIALTGSGS